MSGDGAWALAPFWRKNKDHAMLLIPILHALNGGALLWAETGLHPTAPMTTRNLLRLIKCVQDRPHREGVYSVHPLCTYAHVANETDVRHSVRILNSSMKLTELGFGASQTRTAPLLKMATFLVTAREMSTMSNVTPFQFKEMSLLAQRQGMGVYVECGQYGWKDAGKSSTSATQRSWSPKALSKLGGHSHVFFVKNPIPSAAAAKASLSARAARCGVAIDVYEAALYPQNLLASKARECGEGRAAHHVALASDPSRLACDSGTAHCHSQARAWRTSSRASNPSTSLWPAQQAKRTSSSSQTAFKLWPKSSSPR